VHSFVLNSAFHWQPFAPGSWEPLLYELEANHSDNPLALSALVVSSAAHVMRLGERACAADEHDFRQFGEEMAAVAGIATPVPDSLGLMVMLFPERKPPPPALLVPHGVPRRLARRPIASFDSIIIWAWEVGACAAPFVFPPSRTDHPWASLGMQERERRLSASL
jgi:hypothetical protein